MNNRIAIWLGALLITAIIVDVLIFGTDHVLFLSKKMLELIEWMAFWR